MIDAHETMLYDYCRENIHLYIKYVHILINLTYFYAIRNDDYCYI